MRKQNTKNREDKNSNNTSGFRNVFWLKEQNQWCVQMQVNGKNTRLGIFDKDKLVEAAEFAKEMREKYYGEFAGNG